MRNLLYTISAITMLSSCSWISDTSNNLGSHMPVVNEEKRCANSYFCGSESKNAVPSQYQYQAPGANSPIPPQTYQAPSQPYPQGLPSSAAPSQYPGQQAAPVQVTYANDPRVAAAYAPVPTAPAAYQQQQYAQPMAPTAPMGMPQMPTQAQIMAGQQVPDMPAGYGAMPQQGQMPGMPNMPMIPPNPYDEAAKDPRLQSFEANPDWKDKMPERSAAAQQFEESQKPGF